MSNRNIVGLLALRDEEFIASGEQEGVIDVRNAKGLRAQL